MGAYQDVVSPCLELTTPQTTKDHVIVAVVVQDGGVDAVSTRNGVRLRLEFSVWLVGLGYSDPEDAFLVLGWEEEKVLAVLLSSIGSPQLLLHPWDIRNVKKLVFCQKQEIWKISRVGGVVPWVQLRQAWCSRFG